MTIFPILNGPSKREEQQGESGSHQPVKFTESIYMKYRRLLRGSEYLGYVDNNQGFFTPISGLYVP